MRRKKSKYKYATIGKKKYYFYKIVWNDPCGDSGHAEADEVKNLKPAVMISQAYIFDKDKKHVWTFSSYDSEAAVFSDRNCFPRSIISKMEKIKINGIIFKHQLCSDVFCFYVALLVFWNNESK